MSRLNKKLDLNVLSSVDVDSIREGKINDGIQNLKSRISELEIAEAPKQEVEQVQAEPRYKGTELAEVAVDVYRANLNPKVVKFDYDTGGPDTHADRVNKRSIQRALLGLRNGGNEGKLSQTGPNGNGNVGKYSPTADNGAGNQSNHFNNYYALTTDMTLEQYEDYITGKFQDIQEWSSAPGSRDKPPKPTGEKGTPISKDEEDVRKKYRKKTKGTGPDDFAEEILPVLKDRLLKLENSAWQSIDVVMRSVARENDITPRELHKMFKREEGMIPDEWLRENREVEMAGFIPLCELACSNPVGVIYNVSYMFRGGTQRHKFLVPNMERPSQEEMEEYVRGFWPYAKVLAYYPDAEDNEQNSNTLVAVPPVTENYEFYTPEDWTFMSDEDARMYSHICEEEGEPLCAPEEQEDGTFIMLVSDHDTGEHKYIAFGEGKKVEEMYKPRGEDSPTNRDITKQGAERQNAVAKLMQNKDMQKKMDDAIARSVQRDREDRKRRFGA